MRFPSHPSASWRTHAFLWFWVGEIFAFLALCEPSWALSAARAAAPASTCITARRWKRWTKYERKLRDLLDRIERPPLRQIELGSRKYRLPLRAKDAVIADCSQEELEYLSGFFDGDGSVVFLKNGYVRLQASQTASGVAVLLRFRDCFGGSIGMDKQGHGTANPTLQWMLAGGKARKRAATKLARHSYTQHAKLRVASQEGGRKVRANLRECRAASKIPPNFKVTWSYLSGFFDAEGCIRILAQSPDIQLRIVQKKPSILRKLLTFLKAQGLESWALYESTRPDFTLCCCTSDACKQTLRQLLANNLSLKHEQARIALRLSASTHGEARKNMSQLVGLQGRYTRLGPDGRARSKEITRRGAQIRRCKDEKAKETLMEELAQLKEEHKFQNLQYRCQLLSSDIRNLTDAHASNFSFRPAGKVEWR
eukprot:Skav231147  [mRNA]  locus=scaffold4611:36535:37809:+ [translate_table: standard]